MAVNWAYQSATQLLNALAQGETTSRALVDYFIDRIEAKNSEINAVVNSNFDAARRRAEAADQARQRGESWGPLHGIPMTIKDTYEVEGMPCTAGSSSLGDYRPGRNAVAVERLQQAGAIFLGKTNVPTFGGDVQTFNKLHGTTNNPWDPRVTSGGSSGGAAAALAAGFTPIELGSDLAGSIRTPSSFCGVFGHKPTNGIVSLRGHIPGPPGTLSEPTLAVSGPMARSAADLKLLLDVIAGGVPALSPGWQVELPPAEQTKLADFKVLWWVDDPLCPLDSRLQSVYAELKQQLIAAGANITDGPLEGLSLEKLFPVYMKLLGSSMGPSRSQRERQAMALGLPLIKKLSRRLKLPFALEELIDGMSFPHVQWQILHERQLRLREKFVETLAPYDVVIMPVTFTQAFPHQHKPELPFRKLLVDGVKRDYTDLFMWIGVASMLGLPATVAPIGQSGRLPVAVQIAAAPYQDNLSLKFAELLEAVTGGFTPPPQW